MEARIDQVPTVSVVIPTFNRSQQLCRSIQSVLRQTFSSFELIVVDDGSTDDTTEVVAGFADSRIRYTSLGKNCGGNYARNRGIQVSQANYVAFLDSDDEWLPTKLERQLARLEGDRTNATVVYSQYYEYQEWTKRTILLDAPHEGDVFQFLLRGWCPALSTFMIQRAALIEIGGFDETLPSFQDYDLFLRLAQKGNLFIAAPEPLVKKYVHQNHQVSGNWSSKLKGFELFQNRWSALMKETLGYFGYRHWVANHLAFVGFRQIQSKSAEGKRLEAVPHLLNVCYFLPWSWQFLLKGLILILMGEGVYGSLSRAKNTSSNVQEPASEEQFNSFRCNSMKFSLVLATLNRTAEVAYFLKSLDQQTYRSFELIVVDQNLDNRLFLILEPYKSQFPILHLKSSPGLSHARNVALEHVSGDIVAFPDDDCAYPPNLLDQVAHFFATHTEWNGLTGKSVDRQGRNPAHLDDRSGPITPLNVWRRGISYTVFLRKEVIVKAGIFDESLGVGASTPWGSGEETDYLLRAIDAGLYYESNITVTHPIKVTPPDVTQPSESIQTKNPHAKSYAYAMGRGRVLRKHNAPLWFVMYNWLRPLMGVILSILQGRFDRVPPHWATFQGRVRGWLGWA